MNKIEFSLYIEQYSLDNRLSLADSLLEIMEKKDLDENWIAANITETFKQKLAQEYKEGNDVIGI